MTGRASGSSPPPGRPTAGRGALRARRSRRPRWTCPWGGRRGVPAERRSPPRSSGRGPRRALPHQRATPCRASVPPASRPAARRLRRPRDGRGGRGRGARPARRSSGTAHGARPRRAPRAIAERPSAAACFLTGRREAAAASRRSAAGAAVAVVDEVVVYEARRARSSRPRCAPPREPAGCRRPGQPPAVAALARALDLARRGTGGRRPRPPWAPTTDAAAARAGLPDVRVPAPGPGLAGCGRLARDLLRRRSLA